MKEFTLVLSVLMVVLQIVIMAKMFSPGVGNPDDTESNEDKVREVNYWVSGVETRLEMLECAPHEYEYKVCDEISIVYNAELNRHRTPPSSSGRYYKRCVKCDKEENITEDEYTKSVIDLKEKAIESLNEDIGRLRNDGEVDNDGK